MSIVHSFAPLASATPRVLILGSMPGKASLTAQQYYAHPRNAFWKILAEFIGFDHGLSYGERVSILDKKGIAVWDVVQMCTRESSLDSDIVASTVVPNDFAAFFAQYPGIQRVCLNGSKAAELYRRHVQSTVVAARSIETITLPSTSPANAGVSYEKKSAAWRQALLC